MTFRKSCLAVLFLSCTFNVNLFAQRAVGFDFLRAFVGARPAAMSGAFIAIPNDIHSLVYNPAGLTGLSDRQGTLSYINHLLDFQSGFLAYAQPWLGGTAGVAINFFDYGSFEGKDENNLATGDFGANSVVLSASFAKQLTQVKNLSLGATAKVIRFQIDDFSETALAADFGVFYEMPDIELRFGAGVFNVGTATSAFIDTKDDLPLSFQLGASKKLAHLPLLISATILTFKDDGVDFRLGGEFTMTEQLFFRFGYNSVGQDQKVDSDKDKLAGVSIGLGFKMNAFNFDYSFSSFGEVGSLNRITLTGRF